ncbi:Ig-like domain-containing protein [Candidatus Uhrbacteria bacterium]|nr:Ig-like domain-containing protein [Candidatus Uhrbacteria bacterium]
MLRRFLLLIALALPLFGGLSVSALPVQAQVTTGLEEVGQTIKLPSTDPRLIVVRIINIALGLIGIILVCLILYAGFLWMTSGGKEDQISRAKQILRNAIIGLIIILSAWAITKFVIERLLGATSGDGGGGFGGDSGFGGGFGGGSSSARFQVQAISPKGTVSIRNVEIKMLFTKPVDDQTVSGINIKTVDGTNVPGTLQTNGALVTFTPEAACPAPNQSRKCFDADQTFTVTIPTAVKSLSGQSLICSASSPCTATFTTGNVVDVQAPNVTLTYPFSGMSVSVNSIQLIQAAATDDSGVSLIEFYDAAGKIGIDAASGTPMSFNGKTDWDTAGTNFGEHTLSAVAHDIDANTSTSSPVTVVIRSEHCFNGQQDEGETGLDCGGDPQSSDYCGACSGGSCSQNFECSSGFCQGSICVAHPVISSIDPINGKPGTFVTIKGTNFGFTEGEVVFLGNPSDASDDKIAKAPLQCVSDTGNWGNTQVVVAVPEGAGNGPIQIKNVSSGLVDSTDDAIGPKILDFVVDDTVHPGLCALKPNTGIPGTEIEARGLDFGTTAAKVVFGKLELTNVIQWTTSAVRFKSPVTNSGIQSVTIKTSAGESNPVDFLVIDKNLGAPPVIASLSPDAGPKQEYVTILGKNFGYSKGFVLFTDPVQQLEAIGDTSFPAACANGFWRDDSVIIKVPQLFKNSQVMGNGVYKVSLRRADNALSNSMDFTIQDGNPKPGICSLNPAIGPEKTTVKIEGERLGTEKPLVFFSAAKGETVQSVVEDNFTDLVTNTIVPKFAITGSMSVKVQGQESNKVNFQVLNCNQAPGICGPEDSFQCCPTGACRPASESCGVASLSAQYAWQASTGIIPIAPRVIEECRPDLDPTPYPSPSPWMGRAGGDQAPTDSAIQVRFSRVLNASTVVSSNFLLLKCTGTGSDACATTESVPYSGLNLIHAGNTQDIVKFNKNTALEKDTTYLVQILANVKANGPDGAMMEVRKECGVTATKADIGYCFRFKTRNSDEPSKIHDVNLAPNPYEMHDVGETTNYLASPVNSDDKCIYVECSTKQWSWYTGSSEASEDNRASISKNPNQNLQGCVQQGVALKETGDVPVDVNAKLLQSSPVVGTAKLFVRFLPPRVLAYGPNCDLACTNALIWANFSTTLDLSSVTTLGNIVVHRCLNEQCNPADFTAPIALKAVSLVAPSGDTKLRRIEIEPQVVMTPGAFYHVLLRGGAGQSNGIKGLNGVPMDGLNTADGFAWKFRVKQEPDAYCVADRVEVVPEEKFESRVGTSQLFNATPYGVTDACSATGQALVQTTQATWNVTDPKVATLWKKGNVNTGGVLPEGCSGSCLLAGAPLSIKDKTAVCGNGTIETTNTAYCKNGKTPAGDACFLLAAGANGGEECEPGVGILGAKCDSTSCLILADPGSSTCGNGIVDPQKGEECDYGPTCVGASLPTNGAPAVPEFATCLLQTQKDACIAAGGECKLRQFRGCSESCKHLGALAGLSSCGNYDVLGDGKDCDDGNSVSGDGCSAMCLHEGSKSKSVLYAVCGNLKLEPGEACEATGVDAQNNAIFPAGCNVKTCLHTGVAFCTSVGQLNCCGNSVPNEPGKDCDDGNSVSGDGCSEACLYEGSSPYYVDAFGKPAPSFCSDGIKARGEQCEAIQSGDSFIDRTQLASIVGDAETDSNGLMKTDITANVESKDGKAVYGLQCGFTDEASCEAGFGLDDVGCCRPRPSVVTPYPPKNAINVCRNVLISGAFNEEMRAAVAISNFEITEDVGVSADCPQGTSEVLVLKSYKADFWGGMQKRWDSFVAWLTGEPVYAEKWCKGGVTGQLKSAGDKDSKLFTFTLDQALKPNTQYRVRFFGDQDLTDNSDKKNRQGVMTAKGVVQKFESFSNGELTWTFKTGNQVCAVNQVEIRDTTSPNDHPFLFVNPNYEVETRAFQANAQSIQNGQAIPLSPVQGYDWKWDHWTSSAESKKIVMLATDLGLDKIQSTSDATFVSGKINGTSILTARMKVENDTINTPSSKDLAIEGVAPVSVLACQNPWPALNGVATAPFRDMANSPSKADLSNASQLVGDPFASPMNFLMMYCRDDGSATTDSDDLPAMDITFVPKTFNDVNKGIIRQYLLTYPDSVPGLKQDGIGIRVYQNPLHLSPEEWYAAQGFSSEDIELSLVDGYPALIDGNTIYIAISNRPGVESKIYSNIFVFSFNPNAEKTTQVIAKQLLESMTFNINVLQQGNVCLNEATNDLFAKPEFNDGRPIRCNTDWDCLTFGNETVSCESQKAKLARDTIRIGDFFRMAKNLEKGKIDISVNYPSLKTGTFLPGQTNSLWSSWTSEMGGILGGAVDPINRMIACGRCEKSISTPCSSNADCPTNEACRGGRIDSSNQFVFDDNVDPASCWNKTEGSFSCPRIGALPSSVSRLYMYRALNTGKQYELGAEFEIPPTNVNSWWDMPLPNADYRCFTEDAARGRICAGEGLAGDKSCRVCSNPLNCFKCVKSGVECAPSDATACSTVAGDSCGEVPTVSGVCQKTGGNFKYSDICKNTLFGQTGVCGDGIVQQGEVCEIGQTKQTTESCPANQSKLQICSSTCQGYQDDPKNPSCTDVVQCGNGKIDRVCTWTEPGSPINQSCVNDQGCVYKKTINSDPVTIQGSCVAKEVCDDGVLNGSYAHCNPSCSGYDKFCGNGKIEPGELCDEGSKNGVWNESCALDCKGPGPKCGDKQVNANEQCDGNSQTDPSAICSSGMPGKLCQTDADCSVPGSAGTCGGGQSIVVTPANKYSVVPGPMYQSCVGKTVTDQLGAVRDTQHVRGCADPSAANKCQYLDWSPCVAIGSCGDGILDEGEKCDDGNTNNNDSCTNICQQNSCGDGYVNSGVEECDNGADNGKVKCNAEYGSSCLDCNNSCKLLAAQGGFCGDGIKNGSEQCDGNTPVVQAGNCPAGTPDYLCEAIFPTVCMNQPCLDSKVQSVSCLALGYDFSSNPRNPRIIGPATPPEGVEISSEYKSSSCGPLVGMTWPVFQMYKECAGLSCKKMIVPGTVPPHEAFMNVWDSSNIPLTSGDFWKCVAQKGPKYNISVKSDDNVQKPMCGLSCSFSGCGKCSDSSGSGVIKGYVYDAVYQQVVPNARVSLMSKGIKVDEMYTNEDGYFTFGVLNTRSECNTYRLVIDMYQDNPCTDVSVNKGGGTANCRRQVNSPYTYPLTIDEGVLGGYFPFTSETFSVNTFDEVFHANQAEPAHVNIFPRPAYGDAYAAVFWKNGFIPSFFSLHTILPKTYAFSLPVDDAGQGYCSFSSDPNGKCNNKLRSQLCSYDNRPDGFSACSRDINPRAIGYWDRTQLPFTRMICIHPPGDRTFGWNYSSSEGGSINDCPIEGTTACLMNCTQENKKTGQQCKDFCGLGINSLGESNIFLKGQRIGQSNCSELPQWESCYGKNPPFTSFINYKQFSINNPTNEPIRFVWQGDGSEATSLAKQGGVVYLATADLLTKVTPVSSVTGALHIADLNPSTGNFEVINQNKGADMHTQGQACYSYAYQCNQYSTPELQKLNW